jgi:DnaJ-class molecular chaperone
MEYKDYYKILGVQKSATGDEINKAYRRLARKYHPDLNPGDKASEARFKEINEAHEVLADPERRQQYDAVGPVWNRPGFDIHSYARSAGTRARGRTATAPDGGTGGESFSDFFQTIFGQSSARAGARSTPSTKPRRGDDLEQPVEVTLEEAFAGGQRMFTLTVQDRCTRCGGSGQDTDGKPCSQCRGSGWMSTTRRIDVKIPAGVKDGSRVRIAAEGNPGVGGAGRGDLYLVVTVKPHTRFRREDDTLLEDVDVPFTTLVLGGEVQIPTLKGRLLLRIPAGTANGKQFRLAGQGMPRLKDGSRGDLLVKVHAMLPGTTGTPLTPREKQLFAELSWLSDQSTTRQA